MQLPASARSGGPLLHRIRALRQSEMVGLSPAETDAVVTSEVTILRSFHRAAAAAELGISQRKLYYRLEQYLK